MGRPTHGVDDSALQADATVIPRSWATATAHASGTFSIQLASSAGGRHNLADRQGGRRGAGNLSAGNSPVRHRDHRHRRVRLQRQPDRLQQQPQLARSTPPVLAQAEAALFSRDASGRGSGTSSPPRLRTSPPGSPPGRPSEPPPTSRCRETSMATARSTWPPTTPPRPSGRWWLGQRPLQLPARNSQDERPGRWQFRRPRRHRSRRLRHRERAWAGGPSRSSGGLRVVSFGLPGDIPEPGDYEGTGKDQLAVYRPSTGQFIVLERQRNR